MRFGIHGNINKPAIVNVTEDLITYMNRKRLSFVVQRELGEWFNHSGASYQIGSEYMTSDSDLPQWCDVIIALGGDGTMLTAARIVGAHGNPILGVNLGKLGFLAEVSIDELQSCLDDITAGKYFIEDRVVLQTSVSTDDQTYYTLNDVVIDKGSSPRIIDMETNVNGDYLVTYTADGLIIATPTGSTAYSLASGGPIVVPKSDVVVITPISPHTLSARPVIVPNDSCVKIKVAESAKPIHMIADGQIEKFYNAPVEFTIQKASYNVKLIKRKKRNYFDLLRMKLMWGKDLRREQP
jgi:NAD+ kinase